MVGLVLVLSAAFGMQQGFDEHRLRLTNELEEYGN